MEEKQRYDFSHMLHFSENDFKVAVFPETLEINSSTNEKQDTLIKDGFMEKCLIPFYFSTIKRQH